MSEAAYERDPQVTIDGIQLDLRRKGRGQPLLFLQGLEGWIRDEGYSDLLAQHFEVILPQHPGFGQTDLPRDYQNIGDFAYFYLSLLRELDLRDVILVGSSFGGWIAAEMAVRNTDRLASLVLVDALGIKVNGRNVRDIADIYAMSQAEVAQHFYHDPEKNRRDITKLPDHVLRGIARSRETMCLFGWQPYMHNPTLKRWLKRIDVPTLVVWGESDGFVSTDYGRAYAASIPGAEFVSVAESGHYPHLEQTERFTDLVTRFCANIREPLRKAS